MASVLADTIMTCLPFSFIVTVSISNGKFLCIGVYWVAVAGLGSASAADVILGVCENNSLLLVPTLPS